MSQHFSGALFGSSMGLRETMLALATAGGPSLAGLLRDMTGSYAVPWLAAADVRRSHTADPVGRYSPHHAGRQVFTVGGGF
jgi:hypothetical protein